ncbi:MAG: sigma-70 family RNA polymerase sigma factor [Bacteroidales bacterium]
MAFKGDKKYNTEQLLELLKGKQEERDKAIVFIYLKNKQQCFRKAARLGITPDGFEDIFAEAFMKFVDAVFNQTLIRNVHAYLRKVFENNLFDEMKKNKKNPKIENLTGLEPEPEPDIQLSEKAVERIWETMQKLPPKYREYLILHHMEGVSLKEIASEYDTKPEIVKTELSRGRNKFMELYNDNKNE